MTCKELAALCVEHGCLGVAAVIEKQEERLLKTFGKDSLSTMGWLLLFIGICEAYINDGV